MGTFNRIIRHLTTTGRTARRLFPQATLGAIQAAIGAGETVHRAQVRLIVEAALDWSDLLEQSSARARAHALFSQYRIWDTEENCGVLIYINLADHKVEIITDRAVGHAVPRTDWEAVCGVMTHGFAQGKFHDSALAGVAQVNTLLAQHFPAQGEQRGNELSDKPVML